MAARDIVYFDGLRKLFYIKKRRDRWELPVCSAVPAQTWGPVPLSPSYPGPARWKRVTTSLPSQGLVLGVPRPAQSGLMATFQPFATSLGHPTTGLPIAAAILLPIWVLLTSPARSALHPAHCGGLQPLGFCLFPPVLSPQPLWALLGWYPQAGGHRPVPSGTQSSLLPVPVPARTTRSPPEQQPASWATCGNTPSSTGTSRWYVPPPGASSSRWDPGMDPEGGSQGSRGQGLRPGKPHHPNASRRTTGPSSTPPRPEGVGMSPEHRTCGGTCTGGVGTAACPAWGQRGPVCAGAERVCVRVPSAQRGAGRGVLGQER